MSDLVFEKLSQALAVGESWRLNIAGDFFRVSEAVYPVSVSLLKGLRIVGTMRNMLAGDYVRDIAFDGVIIDNGATAQNVSAQIAGGGAGSDRVIGEVSVIDGAAGRTAAGRSFWGAKALTAAAGNMPHVQLYNPVASGVNLIVEEIGITTSTGLASVAAHAVALSTLVGGAKNKMIGLADSVGEVRYQESASALGTRISQLYGPALVAMSQKFTSPIVLSPGNGLLVYCGTAAGMASANFQFYEEVIE